MIGFFEGTPFRGLGSRLVSVSVSVSDARMTAPFHRVLAMIVTHFQVAAPWVEDSVKATLQQLLAPKERPPKEDPDAISSRKRPQPAVRGRSKNQALGFFFCWSCCCSAVCEPGVAVIAREWHAVRTRLRSGGGRGGKAGYVSGAGPRRE